MRTILMYVVLTTMTLHKCLLRAQDNNSDKIERLKQEKEGVVEAEKGDLREEVEIINERLLNNEITTEEAQKLKESAAQKHALNIENRVTIIDNQIALLKRNNLEYINTNRSKISIGLGAKDVDDGNILFGININNGKKAEIKYDRRTYSDLVVAFGFNNAITDNESLDDSDYKIAGSRFFELGWVWNTRVFKNSNFLRVKYGVSYQSNGLKPTDNRYFVDNEGQTELQEFQIELDKSKFRMDNIVIPVHFELGPSKRIETEEKIRFSTERRFRVGLGGYAGVNIGTLQKLKFKENGNRVKNKIRQNYNTSDLIYGLSTYIGFGDMSLYIKYDVSSIFKNTLIDQNNVSLGLRFDL